MDFDSIDWKAEATRVALAFGVKTHSYFGKSNWGYGKAMRFYISGGPRVYLETLDTAQLIVLYSRECREFTLIKFPDGKASVSLSYSGQLIDKPSIVHSIYSYPLARALFLLDLLTPEVENALQTTISTHQKIEWMLTANT